MFLKNSPPMTRRQNFWFYVFCATCVTIIAVAIGYNWWATHSLYSTLENENPSGNFNLRRVSAIALNCSSDHFWGHTVYYRYDETGLPGDIYFHIGRACRDWSASKWILEEDTENECRWRGPPCRN